MTSLLQDIRYAWRWLARSPGFTIVAVLSLGLGVGVNTAMFSVVDAVLLRPLPVSDPDGLVDVFTTGGDGDAHATTSYPDFQDVRRSNDAFTDLTGYSPMLAAVSFGSRSRLLFGQIVTANHFDLLGIRPAHGRLFSAADDAMGAPPVLVLSHRTWTREFGADPSIVGRTIELRGAPYTVVGVAPAAFTGVVPLLAPELWVPVSRLDDVEPAGINDVVSGPGATLLERRGYRWMFVKGRLKPGLSAEQARANVQVVGARLAATYPETNRDRAMTAVPTRDVRMFVPEASAPLTAGGAGVMAVVGLVLLIACANVAGLLVARATARRRELAVRAAIGASPGRLMRQLLVEGVVMGGLGIAVAGLSAWALLRAVVAIELPIRDLPIELVLDDRALIFMALVALAAGLLASAGPAIAARSTSFTALLRAADGGGPPRRWGLRDGLVTGQIALTVILLVVAGLLARSLSASHRVDAGFDTRGLALVSFDTDMLRYSRERGQALWTDAERRVAGLPAVTSVARASPRVPFEVNFTNAEFRFDDRTYAAGQRGEVLDYVSVSPTYFETLGVPIVRGRALTPADREGTRLVAVVSEAMARRYWPDGSAVGHVLTQVSSGRQYEIVGVSADYRVRTASEAPAAYVHLATLQRPSSYNYLIARTRGDTGAALDDIRRALLDLEPRLVFVNQSTMERTFAGVLLPVRLGSALAAGFSALGTLLATLGLYGVVAFAVSRRTREIGIRVALGARPGDVVRLISRQGAVPVIAGGLVGAGLAALVARLLGAVLYGVGGADPVAWAAAAAILTLAATLAHLLPARRALRVDPARTLKAE